MNECKMLHTDLAETDPLSSGHCLSLLPSSDPCIWLSSPTADWSRANLVRLVEPIRNLPEKMKEEKVHERARRETKEK